MFSNCMRQRLLSQVAGLLLATAAGYALATQPEPPMPDPVFDGNVAYTLSQQAVGHSIGDYHFTAANGHALALSELRGRPVVVSLVYTSCYRICSMTTRSLARAVHAARGVLGDDSFVVLTIGFDTPVDSPDAMATFATEQGVRDTDWHFLSGDAATLAALTRDLGFTFQRSPKGFDHLLQTTILDADGRVYHQVYGEILETPLLIEPLKQLVFGTRPEDGVVTDLINRLRMYCVSYDPATGAYRYDYSLYIGMVIGGLIIASVAGFLLRESRHTRRV